MNSRTIEAITESLIADLRQSGGDRPSTLVHRYKDRGHTASEIYEALYGIEGLQEMDVGDEDCPKPYVYLRGAA